MTNRIPTVDKAQKMIDDTKNNEYISETEGKKMITDKRNTILWSYPEESAVDNLITKMKSQLADESCVESLINLKIGDFKNYKLYNWQNSGAPFTKTSFSPSITKVIYGNGKFVAIGWERLVVKSYWSTDGINWTGNEIQKYHWKSICYGQGKFVACATDSDCMAYSTDGINWSYSSGISVYNWISVCYGNGKFVAVNNYTGYTAYSSDGINWTSNYLQNKWNFKEVAAGNGVFVAISDNSPYITYSTDGITWTAVENAPSNVGNICFATFNYTTQYGPKELKSYFLIVSPNTSTILASTDGKTWTSVSSNYSFSSICGIYNYFGTTFILTNYGIFYSTQPLSYYNGCTWSKFGIEGDDGVSTLAYGNGVMVVMGSGGQVITYKMISDYAKKLINIIYPINSKMATLYYSYWPSETFPCTFWKSNGSCLNNNKTQYVFDLWQRIE